MHTATVLAVAVIGALPPAAAVLIAHRRHRQEQRTQWARNADDHRQVMGAVLSIRDDLHDIRERFDRHETHHHHGGQ